MRQTKVLMWENRAASSTVNLTYRQHSKVNLHLFTLTTSFQDHRKMWHSSLFAGSPGWQWLTSDLPRPSIMCSSRWAAVQVCLWVPDDVISTKTGLYLLQVLEQVKTALCFVTTRRWSWSFCLSRGENMTTVNCCRYVRPSTTTLLWLFDDTLLQQL